MVSLMQLWLPIVLAAVAVFVASAIVHMVLKYHNSDYRGLSNEDEVAAAIRKGNPAPGQYAIPYCTDMKDMEKPEIKAKYASGPVALMLVRKPGAFSMGPYLGQWFVLNLVIAVFCAYLASRTLVPGTEYLQVFRVTGTTAFLAYAAGGWASGIWMGIPWSSVWKATFDALLYGLVTGGVFGWRWPGM
jgi:hypothetical protein